MTILSDRLLLALEFASYAHLDQVRKFPKDYPYISHPYAVGFILKSLDYNEDVVVAGILHDIIEDTNYTASDLEGRFGKTVTDYVLGVTEKDKSLPWDQKKAAYRENLKNQPVEVLAISAADLLANRMDVLQAVKAGDQDIWNKFKATPEQLIESDLKRIEILKTKLTGQLIKDLEEVEEKLIIQLKSLGKISK